jgi:hypothetical protein
MLGRFSGSVAVLALSSLVSPFANAANPCGQCPLDKPYCIVGCGGAHCEPHGLEQRAAPDGGICGEYQVNIGPKQFSIKQLPDLAPNNQQ